MSVVGSLQLDNVEYNADRIARLFPKCKPRKSPPYEVSPPDCGTDDNRLIERNGDGLENGTCNGALQGTDDDSFCSRASSSTRDSDEADEESDRPECRTDARRKHKPPPMPPYKLRDSRIIEIAGGREVFSQSRSKACRKSRSFDNDKVKSPNRVWELRARMGEDQRYEGAPELTETVFASEIKSVKHPQTISLGVNGSVIFDDIDENWKTDSSGCHIPQRTYQPTMAGHNTIKETKVNVTKDEEETERCEANVKAGQHVIGSLPIAEYDGSPRRYGMRSPDSPSLAAGQFPRPGFPQRVVEEESSPSTPTSTAISITIDPSVTTVSNNASSFNYLYEYSETRKVLEEFFKPDEHHGKNSQFQELEYELKRRRRPSYEQGNSYVGLRLAEARDGVLQSSPRKRSQDSSEYSNNQDQELMSQYTVSTENLGLPAEFQIGKTGKHHRFRYSISPEMERRFGQSRNFTLSPDTTDCESFGEGESDVSSLMLVEEPDRLCPGMPVVEDGLSSGHNSETENNATVLLMKKQITEIEREIIEKGNRTSSANSTIQPMYASNGSAKHNGVVENADLESRIPDLDLNLLDPLSNGTERSGSPPPPAPAPHRNVSGAVEATIKDIRMTLQRTKTLPLRPSLTNGEYDGDKSETPVWIPRRKSNGSGGSGEEDDLDTDLETDRLLGQQRTEDQGFFDEKFGWRKKSRALLPFLGGGQMTPMNVTTVGSQQLATRNASPLPSTAEGSLPLTPVSSPDDADEFADKKEKENNSKKKARNKEGGYDPSVLIEGVLFRARYLGSTQLVCEGQPTKATRMLQAEEAVSRIKVENHHAGCAKASRSYGSDMDDLEEALGANLGPGTLFRLKFLGSVEVDEEEPIKKKPAMMKKRLKKNMVEEAVIKIKAPEGESQPRTEVDLFISTEKIMVLNSILKEIMMDHALRTISYIADIGDLVVLMARRRIVPHDIEDPVKMNRTPKMICHVFESEEAQFIAQSIGQAFQVAYMEFLKANGIEDHGFMKEMDYQEVLNSQEIFGDELQMFAKKELQKEVVVPKMKGEILGVVIVESGWGSMLPTVVIANLAPSGAAARCGQLNIGDQIIAVNGVSLVGLPLCTCQNYIKNSKPHNVVKLTVVPCAPVVEVKIKRPDTKYQLGFSVQNGVICSLLRGGIAERGGVRVGHRIIEINNQSVVAVPHEKIVTLLATSVGEILMKTMPTSMFRLLTGQETPVFI